MIVPTYLAIDLETTGLDPNADRILEVGWALLDKSLNYVTPVASLPVRLQPEGMARLAEAESIPLQMHIENGLLLHCSTNGLPLRNVETEILEDIAGAFDNQEPRQLIALGSSVHSDVAFVKRHMPRLAEALHYRILDVSSIMGIYDTRDRSWPESPVATDAGIAHRAAEDIEWSISMARAFADDIAQRDEQGQDR